MCVRGHFGVGDCCCVQGSWTDAAAVEFAVSGGTVQSSEGDYVYVVLNLVGSDWRPGGVVHSWQAFSGRRGGAQRVEKRPREEGRGSRRWTGYWHHHPRRVILDALPAYGHALTTSRPRTTTTRGVQYKPRLIASYPDSGTHKKTQPHVYRTMSQQTQPNPCVSLSRPPLQSLTDEELSYSIT